MARRRVSRRKFLRNGGTVLGTGAAAAAISSHGLATAPAPQTHAEAPAHDTQQPQDQTRPSIPNAGGYQFLGAGEASIIRAIAARIIPADDLGPSAADAGVTQFIDRALAGFNRDSQGDYRRGLLAVDKLAQSAFGERFAALRAEQQDELLRTMEAGTASGFDAPSARTFFELLRRHVMEGFFSDPVYGGNRDFIGWRLVNFPGPVSSYTAEEMQSGQVLKKPFVSLANRFPS